jgi:hypothetical protein
MYQPTNQPTNQPTKAAEERERKRKAKEGAVAEVGSQESLEKHCYALPAGKTCALLSLPGGAAGAAAGEELAALAKRFSKEGFAFAAVDSVRGEGREMLTQDHEENSGGEKK